MRAAILNRSVSLSTGSDISGSLIRTPAGGVTLCRRNQTRNFSSSPAKNSNTLRRIRSDTDLNLSAPRISIGEKWRSPVILASVEEDDLGAEAWKGVSAGFAVVKENEEVEYSGGSGKGKGIKSTGGSFGDGGNEENNGNQKMDDYYQEVLRADPGNPLLLRNYGRFLHEVRRDLKKAEDCYGRAILACPGDGELLSLYARLIWDSQRDCKRAEAYHECAVEASPDDCYVLGSYAHFLWDAEEEVEEEGMVDLCSPFVEAF